MILKSARIENHYATLLLLFELTKWPFKCVSCKWLRLQYKCLLWPHCNYIHDDFCTHSLLDILLNKRLQVLCIIINRTRKNKNHICQLRRNKTVKCWGWCSLRVANRAADKSPLFKCWVWGRISGWLFFSSFSGFFKNLHLCSVYTFLAIASW